MKMSLKTKFFKMLRNKVSGTQKRKSVSRDLGKLKIFQSKEKKRTNKHLNINSNSLIFLKNNLFHKIGILILFMIMITGTVEANTYSTPMDVFENFEWYNQNYQNNWNEINNKLYYNSSYNIGIGILNPTEKLHLNGTLRIDNTTGSVLLFVNASKNRVGIGTLTPSHALNIIGDLNVTGTSYLGDLVIDSDNITVANLIGRGGDNIRIGNAGADTHSLAADDDLFISGKLEVDGITYLDGFTYGFATVNMQDNIEIAFGGGLDSYLDWSGPQSTENTLVWGLGATSKSIIFTDVADRNRDYDHPAQSNPTIFMHSDQDPDEGNTQWGSIAHDNVSMVIDSGSDNITLDDDTNVAGDLALGDNQVGEELLAIEDNGTDVLFTTNNPVVFNHNVTSENLFKPAYIRSGSNSTIPVAVVGVWTNITFDKKAESVKENIEHTWNDGTNKTFTIIDAGIYQVDYTVSITDSSAVPDAHVAFQLADGSDCSRIGGSYSEIDTVKQNADIFIHNSFLTSFTAGQTVMMQFTASDADVSVVQHGTYNPSPGSAQLSIHKFSN